MDQAEDLKQERLQSISLLEIPRLHISTNLGRTFISNLAEFKTVHCFPKNQNEWQQCSIEAHGYNLKWATGFEIHIGQALDCSIAT